MNIDEVLPGRCSPVADHQRLDMRQRQGLAEKRVIVQIELADRQIIGSAPIGVELA